MTRKRIISIQIDLLSYADALHGVLTIARNREPAYVCFANVHMVTEAHKDNGFRNIVNNARFCFPDGMPLVFYLKKKYKIVQDRIAGIDFMMDILTLCEQNKLSVFFFGSDETTLASLKNNVLKKLPELSIAGFISPPYGNIEDYDDDLHVQQINNSNADLVFVSLGCPKQEKWMAKNYNRIKAPLLGVGAAFEVHAGIRQRAPLWMQRTGMEWLYRIIQEPGRLWKRYLKTNTEFIYLFIRYYFLKSDD